MIALTRLAFGRLALTAILTGACEPAEFPGKHRYSMDQKVILRLSVSQYVPLAYPVMHLIERFVVPWVFDRSTVPTGGRATFRAARGCMRRQSSTSPSGAQGGHPGQGGRVNDVEPRRAGAKIPAPARDVLWQAARPDQADIVVDVRQMREEEVLG